MVFRGCLGPFYIVVVILRDHWKLLMRTFRSGFSSRLRIWQGQHFKLTCINVILESRMCSYSAMRYVSSSLIDVTKCQPAFPPTFMGQKTYEEIQRMPLRDDYLRKGPLNNSKCVIEVLQSVEGFGPLSCKLVQTSTFMSNSLRAGSHLAFCVMYVRLVT